jgi:hypothetical protein
MERFVLTDAQWAKMEPHCLGNRSGAMMTQKKSLTRSLSTLEMCVGGRPPGNRCARPLLHFNCNHKICNGNVGQAVVRHGSETPELGLYDRRKVCSMDQSSRSVSSGPTSILSALTLKSDKFRSLASNPFWLSVPRNWFHNLAEALTPRHGPDGMTQSGL